jgi:hypothetical protein
MPCPYKEIARAIGLAGEVGYFELGAGAGAEPVAPGIAEQVEGEHGDHDGVTKEQKQIPRSARDDNIAILLRGAGRSRRAEEAEAAK